MSDGSREEVVFTSGGELIAAWRYRAAGAARSAPCVVIANGFSLTRRDGLELYAERFQAAGADALVFDHRFLGDSGGVPRQRFRVAAQVEDWRNAVAFAGSLDGVDPARIVPWGYSMAGGHVARLAAERVDIAAAIVVCPFVDGLRRLLITPPALIPWLLPRALADVAGRHNLIPVTGPVGSRGALTLAGEAEGFDASTPPGSAWRNEISPGVFATVAFHRPVKWAPKIKAPLWVGRCADDITAESRSVGRLAERAPRGELHEFSGDHFAPLHGALPERIADEQIAFLRRTVL